MREVRKMRGDKLGGRPVGRPNNLTNSQFRKMVAQQTAIVERIIKKMADEGLTPDDPMAVESLKEAMVVLRTQDNPKVKLAAARLVLDFTKAKPTSKVEHTFRTAEDILDEMAEDEE